MLGVNIKAPPTFKAGKPPPGYIPGIGRGAVGFTTRSDLGSAGVGPMGRGAGRGAVPGASEGGLAGTRRPRPEDAAAAAAEAEDTEADRIYAEVDAKVAGRTKRRREGGDEEDLAARSQASRIGDTFVDLKAGLAGVSNAEWEAIPDIGDRSLRYKKKVETFTPVPDSVLALGRAAGASDAAIDPRAASSAAAAATAGYTTDIRGFSEARGQMLSMRLDRMSDSVSGQTVVDPKGYLTSLGGGVGPESEVEDVKKARLLLKSVITSNPKHGPGWIAAARLEEQAKNLPAARKLIREGCDNCPQDEDVWLEAARLQHGPYAKVVLADAVRALPRSVRLWLCVAEQESSSDGQRAVLRKALTLVPDSETLWRRAVSLEAPEDARIMLSRAVECVPSSTDLWLALARLESYENAKKVLNQARQAVPTDASIWIAAAQLEENQHLKAVEAAAAAGAPPPSAEAVEAFIGKIVARAVKTLGAPAPGAAGHASGGGPVVDRDAWIKHAEDCERGGFLITARVLARAATDVGVEPADRLRTWTADAQAAEARGAIACARATRARLYECFAGDADVWLAGAAFEKRAGSHADVLALLSAATRAVPDDEVLWLMLAKEHWLGKDVDAAREVLRTAFASNPRSEPIWLAAVKVEWEAGETERARALLERARGAAPSPRVWLKSALFEREAGDAARCEALLLEGVRKYPASPKLWMMLGQLYARGLGSAAGAGPAAAAQRAREAYHSGLRAVPTCIPLWLLAVRLEEATAGPGKARALLEAGRLRNGGSVDLWVETVRLERGAGNDKLAATLLAKGLKECPKAGRLWAEDLLTCSRVEQKSKSRDALTACDNDAFVVAAVAVRFWADRVYPKARKWLHRAVSLDKDAGDAWILFAAFESLHGTPETVAIVESRCVAAEPAHGGWWQTLAKDPAAPRRSKLEVLREGVKALRQLAAAWTTPFGPEGGITAPLVALARAGTFTLPSPAALHLFDQAPARMGPDDTPGGAEQPMPGTGGGEAAASAAAAPAGASSSAAAAQA